MVTVISLVYFVNKYLPVCGTNVTIGLLMERSVNADFPFSINRTHGLISIAKNHTRHIVGNETNLEFVVMPVDVTGCTAMDWGAAFAEMHFQHRPHVLIGPGLCYIGESLIVICIETLQFICVLYKIF